MQVVNSCRNLKNCMLCNKLVSWHSCYNMEGSVGVGMCYCHADFKENLLTLLDRRSTS